MQRMIGVMSKGSFNFKLDRDIDLNLIYALTMSKKHDHRSSRSIWLPHHPYRNDVSPMCHLHTSVHTIQVMKSSERSGGGK